MAGLRPPRITPRRGVEGGPAHYLIRPPGEAEGGTPDAVRQQSLPAPDGARSSSQGPDQDRGLVASDAATGARSPVIGVLGRHSTAPALGCLWTGRSSDSDDLLSSCRQATMLRMALRPGQVTKRGQPFARAKRGLTDATHRYGWVPTVIAISGHSSIVVIVPMVVTIPSPDHHQTDTQTGVQHGAQNGPIRDPLRDPLRGPPRGPPARGPPGAPRGPPGPGAPGAPRGPPGAPRGDPGNGAQNGPLLIHFNIQLGVPGGYPPGAPRGACPPGGQKSAHFFGYLITLPVGTKIWTFFSGGQNRPPGPGAQNGGSRRGYLGGMVWGSVYSTAGTALCLGRTGKGAQLRRDPPRLFSAVGGT